MWPKPERETGGKSVGSFGESRKTEERAETVGSGWIDWESGEIRRKSR